MKSTATLTSNYQEEVNGEMTTMRVIGQVGAQDSKGFDFDVTFSPTSTLVLTLGYGFNDSKIREMAEVKDKVLAEAVYGNDPTATKENLNSTQGNWQADSPSQNF